MFLLISFGPSDSNSHEFWNHRSDHTTQRSAYREGLQSLNIGGTTGFVVIYINEDCDQWDIVEQEGQTNVSVGCDYYNFFVQPAPKLILV